MGINLGDIIIDDGDMFGDGVNIAARLEALAEPGGICVSGSAREQVREGWRSALTIWASTASRTSLVRCAITASRRESSRSRAPRTIRQERLSRSARTAIDRGTAVPEHERRS